MNPQSDSVSLPGIPSCVNNDLLGAKLNLKHNLYEPIQRLGGRLLLPKMGETSDMIINDFVDEVCDQMVLLKIIQ